MNRGQKNLAIGLVLLALFSFGAAALVHADFFQQHLIHFASWVTGWELHIEKSKISILRGRMDLEKITVQKPNQFQLQADHFDFSFSPLSLIRGKLITRATLTHPQIVILSLPEKKTNEPLPLHALWEKYERTLWLQGMILDPLEVDGLSVTLPNGQEWQLEKLNLKIASSLLKEIACDLDLQGLVRGDQPSLDRLQISVNLAKHGLQLKELTLQAPKVGLSITGDWKGDLETGSIDLSGDVTVPHQLLAPIQWQLAAKVANHRATIKTLKGSLGEATLEGSGFFDLSTYAYSIPFQVNKLELDALFGRMKNLLLGPSKGTAKVQAKAEGRLPELVAHANAEIIDLHHKILATPRAAGTLDLNWPVLKYDADFFHSTGKTGTSRGAIAFRRILGKETLQALPQNIDVSFDKTPLAELLPTSKVTGTLQGGLKLMGVLTSLKGSGLFTVEQGSFHKIPITHLQTQVDIAPGGQVTCSKSILEIGDEDPLSLPGTLHMEGRDGNIPFSGELSPQLSIRGTYLSTTETLKIEQGQIRNGPTQLLLQGTFSPGEHMQLHSSGSLDFSLLGLVKKYFREGSGVAKMDLQISGTADDPSLQGSLHLSNNALSFRGFAESFSNLVGSLTFQGKQIAMDVKGNVEDGSFRLNGTTTLRSWHPETVDLHLLGNNLSLSQAGKYHMDFDTKLDLKGKLPSPLLSGNIDITNGRYFKKFEVRNFVIQPVEEDAKQTLWDAAGGTQLNLVVRSPGELEIKNNIATIILQTDLKVLGTIKSPKIAGSVNLVEGTFHYLSNDFTLTEGRVEFRDPGKIDPYVNFAAEQSIPKNVPVPTHTIRVEVTGKLSNLRVSYSSNPPESKEDIISLIAYGLTRQQLKDSGRSRQSITANIVASEVADILEKPLTKATRLDIFRLEGSSQPEQTRLALSQLALGKSLTDRWSVEFKTDLSPESAEQTVQTNYYLTDNVLLKGARTRTTSTQKYHFSLSLRFYLN